MDHDAGATFPAPYPVCPCPQGRSSTLAVIHLIIDIRSTVVERECRFRRKIAIGKPSGVAQNQVVSFRPAVPDTWSTLSGLSFPLTSDAVTALVGYCVPGAGIKEFRNTCLSDQFIAAVIFGARERRCILQDPGSAFGRQKMYMVASDASVADG